MVDWLSLSTLSGSGDTEVTVTASSYSDLVARTTILTVSGQTKSVDVGVYQEAYHSPYEDEYLTIEATSNGYVRMPELKYHVDWSKKGQVWYRKNNGNWIEESNGGYVSVSSGDTLQIKGIGYYTTDGFEGTTCSFIVYGNVMSLLWGDDFRGKTEFPYTFVAYAGDDGAETLGYLFSQTNVTNAEDLVLPALSLSKGCYEGMFTNCIHLVKAPKYLPAPVVNMHFEYAVMFQGCTYLTAPPRILAEEVGYNACKWMFWNCRNLVTPPALPATKLGESCYSSMFDGCSSLQTTPVLPATTLAPYCYSSMFVHCSALTTVQAISATTGNQSSCSGMFENCVGLTTAPEIHMTSVGSGCFLGMFRNCSGLVTPPSTLPATTMASACYKDMFSGCVNMTSAPSLPATTLAYECYDVMFRGCSSLTTAPTLPAQTLVPFCYHLMFNGCSSMSRVTCLATNPNENNYTYGWLGGTASNGTFVKASGVNNWSRNESGIPANWTVQNI